jgi:hypothetical protein
MPRFVAKEERMVTARSLGMTLVAGALFLTVTTGCSPKRQPAPQLTDTWTPAAERAEAAAKRAEEAAARVETAAKRTEDAAARVEAMTTRAMRK